MHRSHIPFWQYISTVTLTFCGRHDPCRVDLTNVTIIQPPGAKALDSGTLTSDSSLLAIFKMGCADFRDKKKPVDGTLPCRRAILGTQAGRKSPLHPRLWLEVVVHLSVDNIQLTVPRVDA